MPKLSGIFSDFKDFDKINIDNVAKWLKPPSDPITIFNFYANRICYPQAVPVSRAELNLDLAILRELLTKDKKFLSKNNRKIIIPSTFLFRFPDVMALIGIFADAYTLEQVEGLWTVICKSDQKELHLGSILVPKFENKLGQINITLENKKMVIKAGQSTLIPCHTDRCKLMYQLSSGTFLGKTEGMIEVFGGSGGILIDGRKYG